MSEAPADGPDTINDDLADDAAELILEANEQYQQRQAEQEAFLETVAEEEGTETLETQCNIIGDYTVSLRAKMNGDLIDRMGQMEQRLEQIESGDAHGYDVSDAADRISQILADVIDDDGTWHKDKFYEAYRSEGIDPLGVMLREVFESLKAERERREGTASGFRQE